MPPTPAPKNDPKDLVARRHREWWRYRLRWRWLLDSYEGGETYREAWYGLDSRGWPVHNLMRHKREYEIDHNSASTQFILAGSGVDPYYFAATDNDYALRRARTPVPAFLSEVIGTHLSRIYAQEVKRKSSDPAVEAWWKDVDGCGTTVDEWAQQTVAPLLMALGCLDLWFDHPAAPPGAAIESQADVAAYGLGKVVAGYVLPENMLWWTLNPDKTYRECLHVEYPENDDGASTRMQPRGTDTSPFAFGPDVKFRHWTPTESTLYDVDGNAVSVTRYPYGRPPIVRVFDGRRPRTQNVGMPRYEGVADKQREYYNRDSELILSDTTQAHPLLQGPEDYVQADGTIPIGPSWLLPKKKNTQGGSATYEGFEVVDFPKDGADSLRQNKTDLRDAVDREALLTKPAGAAGTDGNSVSQSGTSKRLDQSSGNDLLAKISGVLQKAEKAMAAMVALVAGEGEPGDPDAASVGYPKTFDLLSPEEIAAGLLSFQDAADRAGGFPVTEGKWMKWLVRKDLQGLDDAEYAVMDEEIDAFLATRVAAREAGIAAGALNPDGSPVALPPVPAINEDAPLEPTMDGV